MITLSKMRALKKSAFFRITVDLIHAETQPPPMGTGTVTRVPRVLPTCSRVSGSKNKGPGICCWNSIIGSQVFFSGQIISWFLICCPCNPLAWKPSQEVPRPDPHDLPGVLSGHTLGTWSRVLSEFAKIELLTDSWEQLFTSLSL